MNKVNGLGIATLLLTSMLTIMVGSAIAPSLLEIEKNLDFQFDSGLLITLPSLGVVVFSPLAGWLLPKLGSFKLLCFGLIPYAIFGYGGGFISNNYILIVDRVLLGGAAVFVQIAATALIAENFIGKKRMQIIAWQGMAIEGGGVLFLSLGGVLGEMYWQYPFLIYLIALICFILSLFVLPKKSIENTTEVNNQQTAENKNIKKLVYIIFAGALFSMIIFFISFIQLPQYLPENFNFSESETGYLMAFISLIAVITASQMPKIASKIDAGFIVVGGFVFFMLGYILFGMANNAQLIYAGALATGIGFGFSIPTLNHLMVEVSTAQTRGKNLGLYSIGVFGGQFLSTFMGFIIKDTNTLFLLTACLSLVVAICLGFLFNKYAVKHNQSKINKIPSETTA
ncbi:MAG: MFS transporter [Thalassobius sp.]|nr:MFS transporter [Thalassovita sp.]